ncbi:hypothetical protein HWV62_43754 [Athelia sp. TMB]|nr:hypothetical protein HWV62_43754 [Athelia sp. TMB]
MQVLVLGLCRTGTQSLADALQILGIGPIYHMREVGKSGHAPAWTTAFEVKYEAKAGQLDARVFDELLGNFAGVSDIPTAMFAEELMKAYPDAKIILTTRDAEKWIESMQSSIVHAHKANLEKAKFTERSPMLKMAEKYHMHGWDNDIEKNGRQAFGKHNEGVLGVAKQLDRDVLVYEVKQGWAPLCRFLGVQEPVGTDFPRSDDWANYKKRVAEEAK